MPSATCEGVPPLLGHSVGVTGDRRSDELASHLRALGATVVHGPVLRTAPITDDHRALRAATDAVLARQPDYVLATTGIGVRAWVNAAGAWGQEHDLLAALGRARVLARGPKVVGAIAEIGLEPWFAEPSGRADAMVDRLLAEPIAGAHVVVQLPGDELRDVVARLGDAGAVVTTVPVYDWTWPDDLEPARRLVRGIVDGRLAAVTFTSRPAVRNLLMIAAADGLDGATASALAERVAAVCIGGATADELQRLTGVIAASPPRPKLGMLAPTVADIARSTRHHHVGDVVVQGRLLLGPDADVTMSEREAAVLDHLVSAGVRTVGRDELLRAVWRDEPVDASVLETTVARLRRRAAATGLRIRTVTGRGYLLEGARPPCPDQVLSTAVGD